MKKSNFLSLLLVVALGPAAGSAQADAEEYLDEKGDRIDARLDHRGDVIDARLDERGDRINARLDARAERARQVIPNLRDVLLLPAANHSSVEVFGAPIMKRVAAFLAEDLPEQPREV